MPWPSPTSDALQCCETRTAVKNYAKGKICSEASRILCKVEDIGCKNTVFIEWFPAHMGSDMSECKNANHNERANPVVRGRTTRAVANTANSEGWSWYSAKDKITPFNEIKWYKLNRQTMPPPTQGLLGRRQCYTDNYRPGISSPWC